MTTELLVREHLAAVGNEVVLAPAGTAAVTGRARRARWVMAVAAAALLVGAVVTVGIVRGGVDELVPEIAAPTGVLLDPAITEVLPPSFDPASALGLFFEDGDAETVALAYLGSRFPDADSLGLRLLEVDAINARYTQVRWAWGGVSDDPVTQDSGYAGWLLLRFDDERYHTVIAATTDGVDLSDITHSQGLVSGTVRSVAIDSLFLDVLLPDGEPVAAAPYPEGAAPSADYRFGTAGQAESAAYPGEILLPFEIPSGDGHVLVRAQLVGGTLLSISEVAVLPAWQRVYEAIGYLAADARPIFNDGSLVYATNQAPEPRFDASSLGDEIALDPATGWQGYTPEDVFPLDPDQVVTEPAVYVATHGVRLVQWKAFDSVLDTHVLCHTELDYGGGGCWSFDDVGSYLAWTYTEDYEDWPAHFDLVALSPQVSVVAIDAGEAGRLWQRPIGGTAIFPVPGFSAGETATLRLLDADGNELDVLKLTPGR